MTYSSTILADSPTAFYEMNEVSGTTATDSSGNSLNGTLHGGVTVNQTALLSALGVCYKFDGVVLTYVSLPNGARQAAPCTFEMWIKDNGGGSNSLWFSASLAAIETGWDVTAGNVIIIAGNGGSFTTGTLTAGTIYYIAITVDGSMNFSGYYAKSTDSDVTALGSANPGGSSINYGSNALYLGARDDGTLNWKGWMSNTAIYPVVLTHAQAKTHFLAGIASGGGTSTRTIPATAALLQTNTRTIPSTAALLQTNTRTIPCTASLANARTIPTSAALLQTSTRIIPCTAALSAPAAPTTNATFYVRSGNATFYVR